MIKERVAGVLFILVLFPALKSRADVVTYVVKVQEERASTRFTLTEWLKIKERMRMMDLWMALFAEPKKPTFAPELLLSYSGVNASLRDDSLASPLDATGKVVRGQFWFTNLVSATTGLRTLNIDLGLEGAYADLSPDKTANTASTGLTQSKGASTQKFVHTLADFRIFGKNIQDSSLVLKAGKYETDLSFDNKTKQQGLAAGGEMTLYFLNFLGGSVSHMAYGDAKRLSGSDVHGYQADYVLFTELTSLRVGYGKFIRDLTLPGPEEQPKKQSVKGSYFFANLLF